MLLGFAQVLRNRTTSLQRIGSALGGKNENIHSMAMDKYLFGR